VTDPETPRPEQPTSPSRTVEDVLARLATPAILPLVIAVIIAGLLAFTAAEYERTRTPVYQATTALLLDSPLAITSNPGSVVAVSEVRIKYAGLVGTDVISQPAADRLGLPLAVVARSVVATLQQADLNIVLRARGTSPDGARQLAMAVGQSLIDYVKNEQANITLADPQLRLSLKVVGKAYPGYRVSPNHRRELTSAAVVGLIALALSYAVARLFIKRR
jgi:hypothetical protein